MFSYSAIHWHHRVAAGSHYCRHHKAGDVAPLGDGNFTGISWVYIHGDSTIEPYIYICIYIYIYPNMEVSINGSNPKRMVYNRKYC